MQVDPSIPESAEPECELQMIDCRVFENVWDGLYVFDGHLVEIRQTEFEQNYANGIWIEPFFEGLFVLTDCQIEDHPESGVVVSGGTVVQLERCTIARSGRIGVFVGDSASLAIHACLILDNLIGVSLVESPFVLLTDCEIRGNLGYGLVVYCLECSGGRHLHDPEIDFTGELTGGGNVIPDASGLDGNGLGGICPAGPWEFLRVGGTEASDV